MTIVAERGGLEIPVSLDKEDGDLIWLGRMFVGEGETTSAGMVAVGSCMIRRLAVLRDLGAFSPRAYPDLKTLLIGTPSGRAGYSQPIAYQWRERGSAARLRRRAHVRSLRWEALPRVARNVAEGLLTGRIRLAPPLAVHFADKPTTDNSLARNPDWKVVPSKSANVLVSTRSSRAYGERISVRPPSCKERLGL